MEQVLMAGAGFKMDLGRLRQIAGGAARLQQSQQLCEELGEMLVSSTRERFRDEQGPDGEAWQTSQRARQEGGQTLTDKGRLKNSVGYEASMNTVAVGTNDIRAAIHNYGGEIKPKSASKLAFEVGGRQVFVDKVDMPKRQFIGFSEEDKQEARSIIQDFMQRGLTLK